MAWAHLSCRSNRHTDALSWIKDSLGLGKCGAAKHSFIRKDPQPVSPLNSDEKINAFVILSLWLN